MLEFPRKGGWVTFSPDPPKSLPQNWMRWLGEKLRCIDLTILPLLLLSYFIVLVFFFFNVCFDTYNKIKIYNIVIILSL